MFSQERADVACNFFEKVLKHTADDWYGRPFLLAPWEEETLSQIFGNVDDEGRRIIEMVYLEVPKKQGKALALDTPIPTPSGWSTMGSLRVGDSLFDENGAICRVVDATETMYGHECYAVRFSDGECIIADADHRWQTKTRKPEGKTSVWTTRQIANTLRIESPGSAGCNHSIPVAGALLTPEAKLPVHPYVLGAWLGDGSSHSAMFTCAVSDSRILEELELCGVTATSKPSKANSAVLEVSLGARYGRGRPAETCCRGHLIMPGEHCRECERLTDAARRNGDPGPDRTEFSLFETLSRIGLIKNKHIPPQYLRASWDQRFALLQGLMDTDGYAGESGDCEFTTVRPQLRDGVIELLRTLGFKPQYSTCRAMLNGRDCGESYRIRFTAYSDTPVFRLPRKFERQRKRTSKHPRSTTRQIVAVDLVPSVPVRCISVDSASHLYLAGESMIATHNTEFVAGIILLILVLEAMKGCQIYGAAAATRQALNAYRATAKMVEQSPLLKQRLRVLRGTNRIVKYSDPDSFYGAIAADGDFGDGVNPSVVIADEVHRWKTRKQLENWDVLTNGGITRKQALTIAITTAGVQNESPLAWRLHEKTRKIEEGIVSDPKFYGKIYGADKEDDPAADATWIKAMPSLEENGGFLPIEKIREKYVTHEAEGDLSSFKRYFLNIWDQKESRAFDMAKWDASSGGWKSEGLILNSGPVMIDGKSEERTVPPLPVEFMKRFIDRRCFVGGDLSMTTDLSSLAFLFPCDDDVFDVLPFFWLPDANLKKLELTLGVPLRRWAEQGFLQLSPGEVIDYRDIRARLDWGKRMFDLREVCWDPWNSRQISVPMVEDGFTCVDIRQGYQTLSEPTKKVLKAVVQGQLHHGNHPVLRWNAGCAATATDGRDNLMFTKPDRAKTANRIDGISALTNAMARAMVAPKPPNYDIIFV